MAKKSRSKSPVTKVAGKKSGGGGDKSAKVELDILQRTDRTEDLNDFIWVMQDEPHASRRKLLIKEHGKEIGPLMGHEPLTKYICAVLIVAQLALAVWMKDDALWGGTLRFYLVAYFIGAPIVQALFLANHEISHNLAFKEFHHNKLLGIVVNIPLVLPYFIAFKFYHNEHHKMQGVEGVDTDLPSELEARMLNTFVGKLFFLVNQTWHYAFRPLFVRPQAFTRWHLVNWLVQLAFIAIMVTLHGWGPILYLLLCAHFSGGLHPVASHFIAEHYVFAGDFETASYYGPLNMMTFNVGYHSEHHDFPLVAWSNLPALSAIGKYNRLPHHKSWTKVMWEFLFNPRVSFYNRVKREPVRGEAAKAAKAMSAADSGAAEYAEGRWKQ